MRYAANWVAALASAVLAVVMMALASAATANAKDIELSFYYPIAVGGPIPKIIDGYVAEFEKENPGITVKAIYAGTYQDTLVKTLTAFKSGEPPDIAVLLSTDMYTLIDQGAISPFDDLIKTDDDKAWAKSFYPAFMANSQTGGKTWGIPFQRSTIVMFYNKDAFKEAGLDPNKAPDSWDELVADGQKLVKRDAAGNITQWGVEIPSTGFPYWLFQGLTTANNARLMNATGTQTFFDDAAVVQALQFWVDLLQQIQDPAARYDRMGHDAEAISSSARPRSSGPRPATSPTWRHQRALWLWASRCCRRIKGRVVADRRRQFLSVREDGRRDARAAAFKFVKWMTTPERAANWGIATGYVAVRPDAWETPAMKQYAAEFPAATVARDQLQYAVAELSTHENQRVTKALNDGLQAALTGSKTPEQAMKDAQAEAARILRPYQ